MHDLKQLYQKFLSRQCTPEEIKYLMDHFHLEGEDTELKDAISAELESEEFAGQDDEVVRMVLDNNRRLINEKISVNRSSWRIYIKVAAVLALITAGSWYLFSLRTDGKFLANQVLLSGDVAPGTKKARLTLSNGEFIDLESNSDGLVVHKNGISYAKVIGGKLTCLLQSSESIDTAYNTITTPKGGVYQLVTPDGSKIWLNASSELRFPTSFGSGNRVVTLKGEAYFEIAKDKRHPFIVKTAGQETEVLGTHFNINSYADELATTTTLFEGAVRVHAGKSKGILLAPGQESVLKDQELKVQKAHESAAMDWINGKIIFNNESLGSIMRKISRWYGVDVQMKGNIAGLKFWGAVSRNNNLSSILNYLKETEDLDYHITGSKVMIFKKETKTEK